MVIKFEDTIFMDYLNQIEIYDFGDFRGISPNDRYIKKIIERIRNVFLVSKNSYLLGVLLYENDIRQGLFINNPNIIIDDEIYTKIKLINYNSPHNL